MERASFEPFPESARAAREFVRSQVVGRVDVDVDVLVLLTSELATNAIAHTRLTFDVTVELLAAGVRIAVHDPRAILPSPDGRLEDADTDLGNRGLAVVAALADSWGMESTPRGKRAWFELCSPQGVPGTRPT